MREAPSSPPPVEIQALVADAITSEPPAAPDQPAAPLAQSVAAAPAQRTAQPDGLQPPIDTTDPRWIDRMAQEIADLANGDGRARFRLNPETLGSMEITVRHTADGISVRFEADNESTRALLAHTEQRLQAEARANGLRIADTQVDLAQQQNQRGGRERPAEQPLIAIRTTSSETTTTAERAPASARYA
jgi:flagellar hook-length control protein FliK